MNGIHLNGDFGNTGSIWDTVTDFFTTNSQKQADAAALALQQQQIKSQKLYSYAAIGIAVVAGLYFLKKKK